MRTERVENLIKQNHGNIPNAPFIFSILNPFQNIQNGLKSFNYLLQDFIIQNVLVISKRSEINYMLRNRFCSLKCTKL